MYGGEGGYIVWERERKGMKMHFVTRLMNSMFWGNVEIDEFKIPRILNQ